VNETDTTNATAEALRVRPAFDEVLALPRGDADEGGVRPSAAPAVAMPRASQLGAAPLEPANLRVPARQADLASPPVAPGPGHKAGSAAAAQDQAQTPAPALPQPPLGVTAGSISKEAPPSDAPAVAGAAATPAIEPVRLAPAAAEASGSVDAMAATGGDIASAERAMAGSAMPEAVAKPAIVPGVPAGSATQIDPCNAGRRSAS
jgi:hypothetical protein